MHLGYFHRWMQPRSVGAKQHFSDPCPAYAILQIFKPAHAAGIRVDVGEFHDLFNKTLLCAVVIGETTEMRDDEIDVRILRGKHVHHFRLAKHIHQ